MQLPLLPTLLLLLSLLSCLGARTVYQGFNTVRQSGRQSGPGRLSNGHGITRGFGGGYAPGSTSSGDGYNAGR